MNRDKCATRKGKRCTREQKNQFKQKQLLGVEDEDSDVHYGQRKPAVTAAIRQHSYPKLVD